MTEKIDLTEGAKADGGKPRLDLFAWDIFQNMNAPAPALGIFPMTETEMRKAIWLLLADLRDWFVTPGKGADLDKDRTRKMLFRGLELLACATPVPMYVFRDCWLQLAIEQVCKVLAFGAQKYADRNWEKGIKYHRVYGAALRHGTARIRGETTDAETNLDHLAHLCCCLMFLAAYTVRDMTDFDNREAASKP